MARVISDQAEGLRRLFEAGTVRVVALMGEQSTSISTALALALKGQGQKVLLIDEQLSAGQHHLLLTEPAVFDVGDVLKGKKTLREISLQATGVSIIPADSQVDTVNFEAGRLLLLEDFHQFAARFDFVIVNSGLDVRTDGLGFALAAPEVIVISDGTDEGITEVYRHIKLLGRVFEANRRYMMMFKGVSEARAKRLFHSLAKVCRNFLGFVPDYWSTIPVDCDLAAQVLETLALDLVHCPVPRDGEVSRFDIFMCHLLGVRSTSSLATT